MTEDKTDTRIKAHTDKLEVYVMKRFTGLFICLLLLISVLPSNVNASGFSQNADAIEKAADSVLQIAGPNYDDPDTISMGSGFIAFSSSILVTNYHVIDEVTELFAWDDEDKQYEIKNILCADKEADIAILEFAGPTGLQPLELYPDDQLKRGSPVVAIGSPNGGSKNTVSTGIISSSYTNTYGYPEIQTNAAISRGSSGGVLLNDDGKVIGITSATSAVEETQNINFAINIAVAQAMYNAWDGNKYTFNNFPSSAKMDFSDVYNHKSSVVAQNGNNSSNVPGNANDDLGSIAETWTCPNCGMVNSDRFCQECGTEKPSWVCVCGRLNSGKFCGNCGKKAEDLVAETNWAFDCASRNEFDEAISTFESLGDYDSGSFITTKGAHIIAKDCIAETYYAKGMYLADNGGDHEIILDCFKKAGDYGDAKDQIKAENDRYYRTLYDEAAKRVEAGEYEAAIELYEKAGDYSDAELKIKETYYLLGVSLLDNGRYANSRIAFEKAGENNDTATMILRSYFEEGTFWYDRGEYRKAIGLFKQSGDYPGTEESLLKSYYALGKAAVEEGKVEDAKEYFTQAGDYLDAKEMIARIEKDESEKEYQAALKLFENEQYEEAKSAFEALQGYKDSNEKYQLSAIRLIELEYESCSESYFRYYNPKFVEDLEPYMDMTEAQELYKKIEYHMGLVAVDKKTYLEAIAYFENAGDYSDASNKLAEAISSCFELLISQKKYEEANEFYHEKMLPYGLSEEKIIMQVGDVGEIPAYTFNVIRIMGLANGISQNEDTYKEKYTAAVQKFEDYFGLIADGKLTLEEYVKVNSLIYKGCKSEKTKALIEKLFDLSYLKNLNEDHTLYANGYFNGVKKAEQDLGLTIDGVITPEELQIILKQSVTVGKPENLKVQVSKNTVTLTWKKVEGLVKYFVYDGNVVLGSTKEGKWVEKNVKTGTYKSYKVEAVKYTARNYAIVNTYIEPYYIPISASELIKNKNNYLNDYVSISGLKLETWSLQQGEGDYAPEGRDKISAKRNGIYLLCSTGDNYIKIVIKDFSEWDWGNNIHNIQDFTGVLLKVSTISIKGYVDNINAYWGRIEMPSIVINSIRWNNN